MRLLVEASGAFETRLHEALGRVGYEDIRPAHFAVFRYLGAEGTRVSELAGKAGMTKQSMGELVAYLERRGYVERRPDPRDGRAKIVVATEAGRRAIPVAAGQLVEMEAWLGKRMGEARLEQLASSLKELEVLLADPESEAGDSSRHR